MATLDRLPAAQRAIIELLVQREQSYDDIAKVLGMPRRRVRELACEALAELAPVSYEAVDPEWRSQLADYLLGQQSGPESTATRGHLRRSEPARVWALSVLDSLDGLSRNGDRPQIPSPDEETGPPRLRREQRRAERAAADGGRLRRRGGDTRTREPEAAGEPARRRAPADEPRLRPRRRRDEAPARDGALSPAARAVVRRRRMAGAAAAALAAVAVVGYLVLRGDDEDVPRPAAQSPAGADQGGGGGAAQPGAARGNPRIIRQVPLQPVEGGRGAGIAIVAEQNGQQQLVVQARLEPSKRDRRGRPTQAYEVWLYNGQGDAKSMGAQVTDAQGNYQGAGRLPADWEKYRFIDVSREDTDAGLTEHSDQSVLRGSLAGGGAGGAGSAPGGGSP